MLILDNFISENIIKRNQSMFLEDIEDNKLFLEKNINGSSVLVIGGAGTIGKSFIKALLHFKPESLTVVDINENGLTELTRDLRSSNNLFIPKNYKTYPMDYASTVFFKMLKAKNGFDIIANFSAHKHVRSEKDIYSIESLVRNNIINAKKLLDVLINYKPKHFFCVSTDKATNPVNIMGASKKIMEDLIMSYSDQFKITTARFANVAFSNGSLLAGFLERISKSQPISAPNDVERYFVSPEESGQICLLACILGNNKEIFFPKLSKKQVMKFSDIAISLLKNLGYEPHYCKNESEAIKFSIKNNKYPVYFNKTNTSGEKMFEEFFSVNENTDFKKFKSLGIIFNETNKTKNHIDILVKSIENIFKSENANKTDYINLFVDFLDNFNHIETGISLDSKM